MVKKWWTNTKLHGIEILRENIFILVVSVCVYGTRAFTYIVRKILMKCTVNVLQICISTGFSTSYLHMHQACTLFPNQQSVGFSMALWKCIFEIQRTVNMYDGNPSLYFFVGCISVLCIFFDVFIGCIIFVRCTNWSIRICIVCSWYRSYFRDKYFFRSFFTFFFRLVLRSILPMPCWFRVEFTIFIR